MPMYHVTNIEWDMESDGVVHSPSDFDLPESIRIEADDPDSIADALSDKYEWCVINLVWEESK